MSSDQEMVCQTDEMYEVEQIRDKRYVKGAVQYLVKWLHWDKPQDQTWQPKQNLLTVLDLIDNFEKDYGNKSKSQKKYKKRHSESLQILAAKKQIMEESQETKKYQRNQSRVRENLPSSDPQQINNPKTKSSRRSKNKQDKPEQKSTGQIKDLMKKKIIRKKRKHNEESHQQSSQDQAMKEEKKQNKKIQLSSSDSDLQEISGVSSPKEDQVMEKKGKKVELRMGTINKMIISNQGQIYYEVDMLNPNGQCIGVKYIQSKESKEKNPKQTRRFLENFLIDEERSQNILNYQKG